MRKKGFTLIELLVVIAIIALLLSILIPALNKVKEQARFIMCQSNLHNYGLVLLMYTTENEGSMPDPWRSIYNEQVFPGETRECRWHNEDYDLTRYATQYGGPLWPYIAEKGVNLCPAFKSISFRRGPEHDPVNHVDSIPIVPQFGYSMNGFLGAYNAEHATVRKDYVTKISRIVRPVTVFFFAEENMWRNQYTGTVLNDNALISRWNNDVPNPTSFVDAFATFHKARDADMNEGVCNAVMADGHVQRVDVKDTHELAWPF